MQLQYSSVHAKRFGLVAAIIFNQIGFWTTAKTSRRRELFDGQTWIAGSYADWAEEIGCTRNAVKQAVATLERAKMIATSFHKQGSRPVTFVRSLDPSTIVQSNPQEPTGLKNTSYSREKKGDKEKMVAAVASTGQDHSVPLEEESPFPPAPLPSKIEETKEGIEMTKASNVADVLAGITGHTKKEVKPVEAKTSTELADVFRTAWADTQSGFLPAFGAKHLGQLNQIRLKVPQGTAGLVIDAVVRNWELFVATAKQEQAAFNTPTSPDLGFMLRFAQSMVSTWKDLQATSFKTAAKAAPKAVQPQPAAQPTKPKTVAPEDQTASLDDVSKLLFGE